MSCTRESNRQIFEQLMGTYNPRESLINRLSAIEAPVLEVIRQVDAELLHSTELSAAIKDLLKLLHQGLGRDFYKRTRSQLSDDQCIEVQGQLIECQYQLRIFFGNVLVELQNNNYPEDRIKIISEVFTTHSQELKKIYDDFIIPDTTSVVETKDIYHHSSDTSSVVFTFSSHSSRHYHCHRHWDHGAMGDFWEWRGFRDGYHGHRDRFLTICSSDYRNGYWQGRGAHAVVKLFSHALPRLGHATIHVARDVQQLVAHVGREFPGTITRGGQEFFIEMKSLGTAGAQHVAHWGTALARTSGSCLEASGSCLSSTVQSAGREADECCKVVTTAVGTAVMGAVNLFQKLTGTAPESTTTTTLAPSLPGTDIRHRARVLLGVSETYDKLNAGFQGAKWGIFAVYGATFGVNALLKVYKSSKNIYTGYKVRESVIKLTAQGAGGAVSYVIGEYVPYVGGEQFALLLLVAGSYFSHRCVSRYLIRENVKTYQEEDPEKYLLNSKSLLSLRQQAEGTGKPFERMQLQAGINYLQHAILEEKQNNLRNGCMNRWMLRVWGEYRKSDREKDLNAALKALQQSTPDLGVYESLAKAAGIDNPLELIGFAQPQLQPGR